MLGEAPGTARLGEWVASVDGGMSLEELANHIAESDAFQAVYPNYSTNREFAEDFLGGLMGGENVPAALMSAAVEIVVGLLNDGGMTRGALALAAVHALLDIHIQGAGHPAHGDLGGVAAGLANRIAVAEHYTLEAGMADPSSDALSGVSSDAASAAAAINLIDNPPAAPIEGQTYILTSTRDDFVGTSADDVFIAEPVAQVSLVYSDTLNPFDSIDGGEGSDTLQIYGVSTSAGISLGAARVSNVENVLINTVGSINADMRSWTGLESVDLQRFGSASLVTIVVDGADVSTNMAFGGDVTLVGADDAVNITAGAASTVKVGSAGHTESVTVKGGGSIVIDNGAGKQSATVTSVSVDGVALGTGANAGKPTLTVNSDAIADVALTSTRAIVLVNNDSKMADGKPMPEDLSVTVNKYGSFKTATAAEMAGKLCIAGHGSAENIAITVAGDSVFDLASNTVKTLDISANAKLKLDVNKFTATNPDTGPSETLSSIQISGAGAVEMRNLAGMKKLATINASTSSGNNSFQATDELDALASVTGGSGDDLISFTSSANGKLATINTGDGRDSVAVLGTGYRADGLAVDLGGGDDRFFGGTGNSKSRIDGGAGTDTLQLSSDGATYKNGSSTMSIYSNFEVLDVGLGSGSYNVGLLGVGSLAITQDTAVGGVTLDNVGGGTPLSVSATAWGVGTDATVIYNLAASAKSPGTLIDGSRSSTVNISLAAKGGSGDMLKTATTEKKITGEADLTITLDSNLRAVFIDSDSAVHATAAGKGVTRGHYENDIAINTGSMVEEVKITGDARANLSGAGLGKLRYVNATENSAGVTVNAATSDVALTFFGSNQVDSFTSSSGADVLLGYGGNDTLVGGVGADKLTGGAGADTLSGGTGADQFIIHSQSESMLSFTEASGVFTAQGFDTITDFATGSDKLVFSASLHKVVTAGEVVTLPSTVTGHDTIANGIKQIDEWSGWTPGGTDEDISSTGATDLRTFIGDGKGLFLTSANVTGAFGSTTRTFKNSIAVIDDNTVAKQGLWLLFDIDGDGNFNAANDMVIFLEGATTGFVGGDVMSA